MPPERRHRTLESASADAPPTASVSTWANGCRRRTCASSPHASRHRSARRTAGSSSEGPPQTAGCSSERPSLPGLEGPLAPSLPADQRFVASMVLNDRLRRPEVVKGRTDCNVLPLDMYVPLAHFASVYVAGSALRPVTGRTAESARIEEALQCPHPQVPPGVDDHEYRRTADDRRFQRREWHDVSACCSWPPRCRCPFCHPRS